MSSERRVRLTQEAWDALVALAAVEERTVPDTASRIVLAWKRANDATAAIQFSHKRGKR